MIFLTRIDTNMKKKKKQSNKPTKIKSSVRNNIYNRTYRSTEKAYIIFSSLACCEYHLIYELFMIYERQVVF